MTDVDIPDPPPGLKDRGREFWKALYGETEFDASGAEIVLEACRTLDRLEALDAVIAEEGVVSYGSTGQRTVHPAVSEARQLQMTLTRLVDALDLPESEEEIAEHERWKVQRAKAGAAARNRNLRALP